MFEHSVKVPRHYKIAANIFKKVYTEGGSVKTLLYDDKLKHFRTNVLYALITETIKHAVDIDKIFENCGILTNEPRLDPWLAKVLTTELLFGKKALPGKSKPEQTIISYKEQFEKSLPEQQDDIKSKVVHRPRYVRINTNLLATSDAIRAFQDEGYKFIRCTSGSYNDYLQQIQSLTEYDFTQDYHVKTMFVFAPGTKMHEHDLYLENQIILQDKATALAVHLLAPPPGSVVLDMCAAPGMKTTQLAAYLRNQGKIYAVERNEERYQILCDFVEKTGSKCIETLHKDSLEIKRGDCEDVEYILLDPSCSGSGMDLHVHNYIEETRLARLTSLQEKFLKHAMNSFPNAKRIVYSTCSLFPEENERVITNVVKTSRAKWRVQDVKELLKGQWNNFGSGMYGSMGTRCLYAVPNSDLTTGFFLAVLDRDLKNEKSRELIADGESIKNETKKRKSSDVENNDQIENSTEEKHKHKKNKKEYIIKNPSFIEESINSDATKKESDDVQDLLDETEVNEYNKNKRSYKDTDEIEVNPATKFSNEIKQKKKKKNTKHNLEIANTDDNNLNNIDTMCNVEIKNKDIKKKKKRKIKEDSENESCKTNLTREDSNIETIENVSNNHTEFVNEISNFETKKKKKKRKTLLSEENDIKKETKDTDINQIDIDNNEEPMKSKKKKSKNKVCDLIENCESGITETVDDTDKPKKKKKKKINPNGNSEVMITDDNSVKKKNKIRHAEYSEIEINNQNSEEVFRKKKKKF